MAVAAAAAVAADAAVAAAASLRRRPIREMVNRMRKRAMPVLRATVTRM